MTTDMRIMNLLPDAQALYDEQLRTASPEVMKVARFLQCVAFNGAGVEIPAPLYLRQACYLASNQAMNDALCNALEDIR